MMLPLWKSEAKYHLVHNEDTDVEGNASIAPPLRSKGRKRLFGAIFLCFSAAVALYTYKVPIRSLQRCVQPRFRQEWRTLSNTQKQEYISAVQCMYTLPAKLHDFGSIPDDFAWVHVESSYTTHYLPTFLLWHRYFISLYENMLRSHCGFSGSLPYWDWARDAANPSHAPVWDSTNGFGGDGTGAPTVNGSRCVMDGPFAQYQVQFVNEEHDPHCLSRDFAFHGDQFTPAILEKLFAIDQLANFSLTLEENSHDAIPKGVGGDFALFTAPDPVWFVHHSNIDRLFWQWQALDKGRAERISLGRESDKMRESLDAPMPMLGLAEDIPAYRMVDTKSDELCYSYV